MKLTPASQEHAENWLGMSAGRWRSSLRDCFPVQARVRVSEPSAACLRNLNPQSSLGQKAGLTKADLQMSG